MSVLPHDDDDAGNDDEDDAGEWISVQDAAKMLNLHVAKFHTW